MKLLPALRELVHPKYVWFDGYIISVLGSEILSPFPKVFPLTILMFICTMCNVLLISFFSVLSVLLVFMRSVNGFVEGFKSWSTAGCGLSYLSTTIALTKRVPNTSPRPCHPKYRSQAFSSQTVIKQSSKTTKKEP